MWVTFSYVYAKQGVGTNVALYVGHNGIRNEVMGDSQRRAPTPDELRSHVSSKLAAYKNPTRYFFLKELPRTGTGKFDRHLLEEMAARAIVDGQQDGRFLELPGPHALES